VRVFRHRSKYGEIAISCLDMNDLLDDKNPWWQRHNTFGTWKSFFSKLIKGKTKKDEYLSNYKRARMRVLKDIVREFCKIMIEDLILKNDSYEFPGDQFARLSIGYKLPGTRHYKYDIKTGGKTYIPVFIFKEKAYNTIQVQYYFSLTRQWRELLQSEVDRGHKYQKPEYEYDRFTDRQHQLPEHPGQDHQGP